MIKFASARFAAVFLTIACTVAQAGKPSLSDLPILASTQVPPNVMLTLSVEWPTGTVAAYNDLANKAPGFECPGRESGFGICYFANRTYLGYFDPAKCYAYDSQNGYFIPKAVVG